MKVDYTFSSVSGPGLYSKGTYGIPAPFSYGSGVNAGGAGLPGLGKLRVFTPFGMTRAITREAIDVTQEGITGAARAVGRGVSRSAKWAWRNKLPIMGTTAAIGVGAVMVGRALQRKRYTSPVTFQQAYPKAGMANTYYQIQPMAGSGVRFSTRRRRGPISF